jgi:hypothetical protein
VYLNDSEKLTILNRLPELRVHEKIEDVEKIMGEPLYDKPEWTDSWFNSKFIYHEITYPFVEAEYGMSNDRLDKEVNEELCLYFNEEGGLTSFSYLNIPDSLLAKSKVGKGYRGLWGSDPDWNGQKYSQ